MERNGLKIEEVDEICIGWNPAQYFNALHPRFSKTPRWRAEMLYAIPNYIQSMRSEPLDPMKTEILIDGIKAKLKYIDHHKCHSFCSYGLSGFEEAINISIDGRGERRTSSVNTIRNGEYKELAKTLYPSSLGLFYGSFTQYCGFRPHSDEWKFMALGALADKNSENKYHDRVKKLIDVVDMSIRIDHDYFGYDQPDVYGKAWYTEKLIDLLELEPIARWEDNKYNRNEYHKLAYAVQQVFEESVFKIIDSVTAIEDIKNITITGGCAMNSLCNGKLHKRYPKHNIYIPPCPDDSGIAIGAAIVGLMESGGSIKEIKKSDYVYTGTEYNNEEIEDILNAMKIKYTKRNRCWKKVAEKISKGDIEGLFKANLSLDNVHWETDQ